jgi:hypothetical protein
MTTLQTTGGPSQGMKAVKLACGHWSRWHVDQPLRLASPFCDNPSRLACKFDGEQDVTDHQPYEWHARCSFYGCSWGRWFGQDNAAAEQTAERHRQSRGADHAATIRFDKVTANGRGTWFV